MQNEWQTFINRLAQDVREDERDRKIGRFLWCVVCGGGAVLLVGLIVDMAR
jgi:hypothetical protein